MKKIYRFLLFACLFLSIPSVQAINLELYSKNAILYNLDEETVLYEKNATERISIASMTKMMTAIVALEQIDDLDQTVTLTNQDFYGLEEANASVAGFEVGQKVTYRDLLYGLLLPSGADAALALTRTTAGGRDEFIKLMNEKATSLGLKDTHFMNETGLDEKGHYSTVEDVATFFKYALKNKDFEEIITTSSYTMSDKSFTVYGTIDKNKRRYGLKMDYLLGGKTGTTYDAGLCLASIALKDDVHYMLVTARAPYNEGPLNLYDAKTAYEYFMNHFKNQMVLEKQDKLLTLDTKYAKEENVTFYSKEQIQKYLSNDFSKKTLQYEYEGTELLTPKIKKGTKLGTVTIKNEEEVFGTVDIVLEQELTFSLLGYLEYHKNMVMIGIVILLLMIFLFISMRKRKKRRRKNGLYPNRTRVTH